MVETLPPRQLVHIVDATGAKPGCQAQRHIPAGRVLMLAATEGAWRGQAGLVAPLQVVILYSRWLSCIAVL